MKEATGELNMTVITVVAIAVIGALFYSFIWPMIKLQIVDRTCQAFGAGYKASTNCESVTTNEDGSTSSTANSKCIPYKSSGDDQDESGYCCCRD